MSATAAPSGTAAAVFAQEGNLVRDNLGMPAGIWFLVYDRPGAPGNTVELELDADSECVSDDEPVDCDSLMPGSRVEIAGSGNGPVRVRRLEVIAGP